MKKDRFIIIILIAVNIVTCFFLYSDRKGFRQTVSMWESAYSSKDSEISLKFNEKLAELYYEDLKLENVASIDCDNDTVNIFEKEEFDIRRLVIIINSDHCRPCQEIVLRDLREVIKEEKINVIYLTDFNNFILFKNFYRYLNVERGIYNILNESILTAPLKHEKPILALLSKNGRIGNVYIPKGDDIEGIRNYIRIIKKKL
ncbi:MAG: hypothetical protein U9N54_13000 [candidate division Zixibacteria bacterium]|nr:hypothetical protein [candidate division Zixibacteria bacterium]